MIRKILFCYSETTELSRCVEPLDFYMSYPSCGGARVTEPYELIHSDLFPFGKGFDTTILKVPDPPSYSESPGQVGHLSSEEHALDESVYNDPGSNISVRIGCGMGGERIPFSERGH